MASEVKYIRLVSRPSSRLDHPRLEPMDHLWLQIGEVLVLMQLNIFVVMPFDSLNSGQVSETRLFICPIQFQS